MRLYPYLAFSLLCNTNAQDDNEATPPLPPPLAIDDPCDPRHSVLDGVTHRFRSDCGPRQWCKPTATFDRDPLLAQPTPNVAIEQNDKRQEQVPSLVLPSTMPVYKPPSPFNSLYIPAAAKASSTPIIDFGVCINKTCRRDEYPFGYKGVPFEELPSMCDESHYCPDDESECQPLIPLGKMCQLNRDDSCGQSDGSTFSTYCLQGLCRRAASGLGEGCILDSTDYLGYNESGHETVATFTRDDCQVGLYCNNEGGTSSCRQEKQIGSSCVENRECVEFNCNVQSKICEIAPQSIRQIPPWSLGLVGIAIISGLVTIVFILYRIHLRHRSIRSDEIDQFFSEQWTYRHSILSMHAAAAMASDRSSHISYPTRAKVQEDEGEEETYFVVGEDKTEDDSNDQQHNHAWASSLHVQGSPSSSLYPPSSSTLSPRHVHHRDSSL
ncbi:hypothetical protein CBS101457_003155 [Exobasidium rhododendri]|nr:hypothetical protein CBS101457_003155 [Exobasidium rhododendri]